MVAKAKAILQHKSKVSPPQRHKTGNRDQNHVHAPSSRSTSCRLSSCIVRQRRVDRPSGIRAYKVVLGRTAASNISVNSPDMEPDMNSTKLSFSTGDTKFKESANEEKKAVGRTAKLKSSKWYQRAARSIGITKKDPVGPKSSQSQGGDAG